MSNFKLDLQVELEGRVRTRFLAAARDLRSPAFRALDRTTDSVALSYHDSSIKTARTKGEASSSFCSFAPLVVESFTDSDSKGEPEDQDYVSA